MGWDVENLLHVGGGGLVFWVVGSEVGHRRVFGTVTEMVLARLCCLPRIVFACNEQSPTSSSVLSSGPCIFTLGFLFTSSLLLLLLLGTCRLDDGSSRAEG